MVFSAERSPITQELAFIPIDSDGFALYELLKKAGLHKNIRVACWDNYEDCIVFND